MDAADTPLFVNRLLASLPAEDRERLRPDLEPVALPVRTELARRDDPLEHVWFPERGVASVLAETDGAGAIEIGVIGRDGMVGVAAVLGGTVSPNRVVVQVPGDGFRLPAGALRTAMEQSPDVRDLLLRYVQAFLAQVSQTAACNGRHTVPERLARWLLMTDDRFDGGDLPLTHEFLSVMLGVRRSGVTVAAGTLQEAGLIRVGHGRITIVDRGGLENAACDCYRIVRDAYGRLLDRDPR